MRKLLLLMHTSLDGFMAGPNGEMNWIKFDEELGEYVGKISDRADTALYGRITYGMMEGYWPTAGDQPDASAHDKAHAQWVNNALKIVVSSSLKSTNWQPTRIISKQFEDEIAALKKQPGKDILLIGSASITHALIKRNLVDEYYINVNPVILGSGIPLFPAINDRILLTLVQSKTFASGVAGLHYKITG